MAAEVSDRVREIAEARGLLESKVFERTVERGLGDLWGSSHWHSTSTTRALTFGDSVVTRLSDQLLLSHRALGTRRQISVLSVVESTHTSPPACVTTIRTIHNPSPCP